MALKKVDLMKVVSASYSLSEGYEAFQIARSGDAMKVILKPGG